MLSEGDPAPDIRAPASSGPFRLEEYLEAGPVVLFFYPKADTPGCTTEASEFDGWLDQFDELGVNIAGCSVDSLMDQKAFADKLSVRYPLIADEDAEICRAYGVLREERAIAGRRTVVIGTDGRILRTYPDVSARGHAEQVLNDLRGLLR